MKIGILTLIIALATLADAQFTITRSAITGGGGQAGGGPFTVSSTAGESSCGSSSGGTFSTNNGYNGGGTCSKATAAPTASGVSILGQTLTADGRGVRNVLVTLTDGAGHMRSTRSNAFGYFEFNAIPSGPSYVVQASARHYSFAPAVVDAKDNLTGIVLKAQ